MIGLDIILVHSFLDQVKAKHLRIKSDIQGSVTGNGGDMVETF